MDLTRRKLLGTAGAGLTASGLLGRASVAQAQNPLNILIIGGTGFIGPPMVERAIARGHKVSVLNRNRKGDVFDGKVEQLIGDLNEDVSVLKGRSFDVVIDNPTTQPKWVRNVAQYLKGRVGHYIFVSTIGVYKNKNAPNQDENAPLWQMEKGQDPFNMTRRPGFQDYWALKTVCEEFVAKTYKKCAIIRPGLIAGPGDDTDCFMYWATRIARGGTVLAPGAPTDPIKYIDTRDLGDFAIHLAENQTTGSFNVMGPDKPLTVAEMLYGIKAVTTAGAQFQWVPAKFLVSKEVHEWTDLPVWVDPAGDWGGLHTMSVARAVAAGLKFRPLADTAQAALAYNLTRPEADQKRTAERPRNGLPPEREVALLTAWNGAK